MSEFLVIDHPTDTYLFNSLEGNTDNEIYSTPLLFIQVENVYFVGHGENYVLG